MLLETWKLLLEYVTHLTFFDQLNEKPEAEGLRAMDQKLPNNEIHALNIIDLGIIAREGSQNIPKLDKALLSLFEKWILRKGPPKITFNL